MYRALEAGKRLEDARWSAVCAGDLGGEPELLVTIGQLQTTLQEVIPATIKQIAAYVRDNPGEFVRIID
ncbi:MAG TPA: hypothetical protein VMW83_17080 [Spirochaetia bacterium]|nr:hypothetical protein [Spirochaetia bacterium]